MTDSRPGRATRLALRPLLAASLAALALAVTGTAVPAAAAAGRAVAPASSARAVAGANAPSVTFRFQGTGLNGYDSSTIHTGVGSTVRLAPGFSSRGGTGAALLHVSLQRDTGTGWRTVSTSRLGIEHVDVRVPAVTTTAATRTVRYRLRSAAYSSAAGRVANTSTSAPVTVVYENQARYTGLAKQMYGFMKPYCPRAAVRVVGTIAGRGDVAGQAAGDSQSVLIARGDSRMSAADRRAVALHECAHLHQWLNYGASPMGDRLAAADEKRYFVNDSPPKGIGAPYTKAVPRARFAAVEHAADCSAIALDPKGYLGYGGYCNPSERRRAAALMRGLRYDLKAGLPD